MFVVTTTHHHARQRLGSPEIPTVCLLVNNNGAESGDSTTDGHRFGRGAKGIPRFGVLLMPIGYLGITYSTGYVTDTDTDTPRQDHE